jgi:hypothetical protein
MPSLDFKPVPYKPTQPEVLKRFLRQQVEGLRRGLQQFHGMDGVVKWRKAYEAQPAEAVREFPWHNASNLVVPVVGIHTDTLLARVLSAVVKTKPYWTVKLLGDYADENPPGVKDAIEEFLQYISLEPEELDLYRVEREWFSEIIKLGTSTLKIPYVKEFEDVMIPSGDGLGGTWTQKTVYDGPRPEKVRFEDFKFPVYKSRLEDMDFKYHIIRLQRHQLEERGFRRIYEPLAVQAILMSPDRESPSMVQSQQEMSAKARTIPGFGWAEWDLCECYFKYKVDASHYARVIVTYHEKSNQILRSYYHYYPVDIFIAGRLFYRDDMFPGMGFAETLLTFQEEISEIHNQRRDNMTIANMRAFRADPDSELHKGYRVFSGGMLPAKQGELEALDVGTPVQGEIDSENLSLSLADKRSGVSQPMQGAGAGTNTKRGVYTAMGTLSIMQEGNTRTDLNITDIRFAHSKVGRVVCMLLDFFGMADRDRMWGRKAQNIKDALAAMSAGRAAIPVEAATSSVNREIEKQNDLMLMGVQERYIQMMMGLMQQVNNPQTPPAAQQEMMKFITAAHTLYQSVLRHFGYDDVDRLAPKPAVGQQQQPSQQPGAMGPQGQPGGVPGQAGSEFPTPSPQMLQQMLGVGGGRG